MSERQAIVGRRVFGGTLTVLAGKLPPHLAKQLSGMCPTEVTGREGAMVSELVTNLEEIRTVEHGAANLSLQPTRVQLVISRMRQPVQVTE